MNTLIILKQAMDIYSLGIEVETKRNKLKDSVDRLGISSPIVLEQSQELDKLLNKFAELERRHLAATEKYMQRRA